MHRFDLIPRSNLSKQVADKVSLIENVEINKQISELLSKGFISEGMTLCIMPTPITPKTLELGECVQILGY